MILRKETEELMEKELKRANEKKPMFHSDHEGVAVIEEEVMEAESDFQSIPWSIDELKRAVYCDAPSEDVMGITRRVMTTALYAASELIQVAAMCKKFRESKELRESREERSRKINEEIKNFTERMDQLVERGPVEDPYLTEEERKCFDIEPPDFLKDKPRGAIHITLDLGKRQEDKDAE